MERTAEHTSILILIDALQNLSLHYCAIPSTAARRSLYTAEHKNNTQFISCTCEKAGMSGRVCCCASIVHICKQFSLYYKTELGGGKLQGNGDISSTSVLQSSAGVHSERGEARHFDVDVSDVDVAGNFRQVHVLDSRDGTSRGC